MRTTETNMIREGAETFADAFGLAAIEHRGRHPDRQGIVLNVVEHRPGTETRRIPVVLGRLDAVRLARAILRDVVAEMAETKL